MKKKHFDSRGAISIFLVIVLVPSIVCSSLFVDAARVKSATGLVSSAGELTLNTVLSQYDVDLNDFYGFMASAQDMDDVLSAAEEYFKVCLTSQDIDTTKAAAWANSIKGFFLENDDVSDLLGVGLAPDTVVKVEPTAKGALNNPALVKTQIVEFMKYRSPINSILSLFEKFNKSSKELENTTKTSDLVEKKQEYYEAQGEVAKQAYEVYKKIVEFDKLGISQADLQEMKTYINSIDSKYYACHSKMVKDLYNTQGLNSNGIVWPKNIQAQYTHNSKYDNADARMLGGLIDKLMRSYDQFISARNEFNNNIKSLPTSGNNFYDVQYWAYCCKEDNKRYFTNLNSKNDNLIQSYNNLRDAIEHSAEGASAEIYVSTYNSTNLNGVVKGTSKSIQAWWDILNPTTKSAVESITKSGSKYNNSVNAVIGNKMNNIYDRISTASTQSELAGIYNTLNDYYTRYDAAFNLLGEIVKGLGTLKGLVSTADNKFETWENKANEYASDIELAQKDKSEIQSVKEEYKKLNESDIQSYINHINNVKSALGTIKDGVKKISYCGQSIIDKKIDGYDAFKKNSIVSASEIPLIEANLNSYVNETYTNINVADTGIPALNFTDNNNPKITDQKKFPVYKWMIEQGFDTDEDEGPKNKYENKKNEAENKIKDTSAGGLKAVASKNDITSIKNLPFGTEGKLDGASVTTKISEVASFVSNLFSNFGETVSQAGVDIRDDLFVLDYITSMFTWQTFEYEAKYNMLDKTQQRDITCDNAQTYFSTKDEAWKSEEVTQRYNKTLTNKLRNSSTTNWSYCNEVEYIMYGKGFKDGKNEAAESLENAIFMIRFALNIPAVFSTFYNDDEELGAELGAFAKSVNLATHGIIPAGLVKAVICLGLTATESARDLKTLKCGIPVIFIKTGKDDLFLKNWLFELGANPNGKDKTATVTFSYSDYMKLILFIKLLGSESYSICGRVADVVQTNMSKCVLKKDYLLANAHVYYTINATLKVKPLMLDSSYVISYMASTSKRMNNWNTITYSTTRGY